MDTGELLQGITGFGTGGSGAPLLMGIGVVPVFAVIIPLLGRGMGTIPSVPWQLPGMPWPCPPDLCPTYAPDYLAAAFWAGVFIWMWNVVIGLVICWFYGKGKAVRKGLPALLILSLIQGGRAADPGQYNHSLLPSGLSLPGGLDTDRQNEDVQTEWVWRTAGLWTVAPRPAHRRRLRTA